VTAVTRVVTAGETMALLDPVADGEPGLGDLLRLRIAGAESNFAIALARLGESVRWISRLGNDRFGVLVHETLQAEGIDLRYVVQDISAPTGMFYKWRAGGRSSVAYYRRGSAASLLSPANVPDEALEGAELVHLTGITLWASPDAAAAAMAPVLEHVDWYLCGAAEADLLIGGVYTVVRHPDRTVIGELTVTPTRAEEVVDEIGAGDAFAAGFAYGLLRGWDAEACARAAHVIAGWALRGTGDWETLPRLDEVRDLLPG
jgi:2-dehydro-3-deoxygluconokinase